MSNRCNKGFHAEIGNGKPNDARTEKHSLCYVIYSQRDCMHDNRMHPLCGKREFFILFQTDGKVLLNF